MQLDLYNIDAFCKCKHSFIGCLKLIQNPFSVRLKSGINFIEGGLDSWGFLTSYILCRGKENKDFTVEKITLDGKEVRFKEVQKISYFLADEKKHSASVSKRIKRGLKHSGQTLTYDEIVKIFHLEDCRIGRQVAHLARSRWQYSAAIACAENKRIWCFPWLSDEMLKTEAWRCKLLSEIAEKLDVIILMPVQNAEQIQKEMDTVHIDDVEL